MLVPEQLSIVLHGYDAVITMANSAVSDLITYFRRAFRGDPNAAFKEWYVLQDGWRSGGAEETAKRARRLADDLWDQSEGLVFQGEEERARFFHNMAVFFGSPGPAANLPRALEAFRVAFEVWDPDGHPDDYARALHNQGNAFLNLGSTLEEAAAAMELFERALFWRPEATRAVARCVTLHHIGVLARKMGALERPRVHEHLALSREALEQAVVLRRREGLREGAAVSLFHLGLTLEAIGVGAEAARILGESADLYEALGRPGEAAVARETARRAAGSDRVR
jgi:hypothetical protein